MGQADLAILHNGLVAQALDELSRPAVSYPFAVPQAADELAKIVIHQFGHVLLGTHEYESIPTKAIAAPLRPPWKKLRLFGGRGE